MSEIMDLVVIEKKNAMAVFTNNDQLDPLIEAIEKEARSLVPDVTTKKGRDAIASMAHKVARSKTYIDNAGKDLVAELKALPKQIDESRRVVRERLDALKDEVRLPLTEWEAEQERIKAEEAMNVLHAEALANTDDPGGAADIVDEIRGRAGIGKLTAAQRASADLMREAVLHERRLELAMEGFRWFDLMRYGDDYSKLFEICDGVNIKGSASYDSYFQTRRAMNDNRVLMPVPTSVLEDNTNIEQNLGY